MLPKFKPIYSLAFAPTGFADLCFVLDGFVQMPLSTGETVLDKSRERRESNPGLLGAKLERYPLSYAPPLKWKLQDDF